MILVGSKALERFELNRQHPSDVDYWGTCHAEGIDVTIMPESIIEQVPTVNYVATPDAIYTIKCSHFGWNIHWEKTKQDILWLKDHGCQLLPELYNCLIDHWKQELNDKSHLSLAKDRKEFFDDYVTKVYDHDYLHELVAYPNRPVYEKCLKEGQQVLIDKHKFNQLPFDQQVRMFREEIAVIAIERWLTNPVWKSKINWVKAYNLALQKVITSLTKGWAQDFIVLNLEHFVKPDYAYFETAVNTLQEIPMSDVDMTPFYDLAKNLGVEDMNELLFAMSMGDRFAINDVVDIDNPDVKEKLDLPEQPDPREDRDAFRKWMDQRDDVVNSIFAQYGYEHVEQDGGGEGGSEDCYGVFMLNGKYYKTAFNYASFVGFMYDDIEQTLREVQPKPKTITVYE